jgi:uncharacterized protein (DUF1684 family)
VPSRLDHFRQHKDEYFADGANSPLDDEDVASFTGLDYFDENPILAFRLEIDRDAPGAGDIIELDTSDGLVVEFARAGQIVFPADDREVMLAVLRDLDRGRYFLPFTDRTSGKETYTMGRYLDPQQDPDGRLVVDFNYAYNPYCAYSEGWSCPLPPEENRLDVRIEAGEKDFRRKGETA